MSDYSEGLIAWAALGLLGGYVLNRNDPIAGFAAWLMAVILGPFTLLLGVWEWNDIRSAEKPHD